MTLFLQVWLSEPKRGPVPAQLQLLAVEYALDKIEAKNCVQKTHHVQHEQLTENGVYGRPGLIALPVAEEVTESEKEDVITPHLVTVGNPARALILSTSGATKSLVVNKGGYILPTGSTKRTFLVVSITGGD